MTERQRQQAIVKLVRWLADERKEWNWTRMYSGRRAADEVLEKMSKLGLLQHRSHRLGGDIWTVSGKKFGRVD